MPTKDKLLPRKPYDLYLFGLTAARTMNGKNLTLEEARDIILADLERVHGYEHVELVNAAYEELKQQENKKAV